MTERPRIFNQLRDAVKAAASRGRIERTRCSAPFIFSMIAQCADEMTGTKESDYPRDDSISKTPQARAASLMLQLMVDEMEIYDGTHSFFSNRPEMINVSHDFIECFLIAGYVCSIQSGDWKWIKEAESTLKYIRRISMRSMPMTFGAYDLGWARYRAAEYVGAAAQAIMLEMHGQHKLEGGDMEL